MIAALGIYLWFSAWGFFGATDMGATKPRERLAWGILFLPILVVASLTELIEISAAFIEGGWKGVKRHWDASFEEAFHHLLKSLDSPRR